MQYKLQYTHNLKGAQHKMNKKIIVVGADYAGLTAAALIADKGFDVTLYEKRAESSGTERISWLRSRCYGWCRKGLIERLLIYN